MSANTSTRVEQNSGNNQPEVEPEDHTEEENDNTENKPKTGSEEFDINPAHQMTFGKDGNIEPQKGGTETSLDQFGVDVDKEDKEPKIDRERSKASSIMCDDRPTPKRFEDQPIDGEEKEEPEQAGLFKDPDGQRKLNGEEMEGGCAFD
jgi:hypothetical protein